MCIHISPLLLDYLPIWVTTEHWVEFPVLYSSFWVVICFILNSVYMSISFSKFIPPPLPPYPYIRFLRLCLYFCFANSCFINESLTTRCYIHPSTWEPYLTHHLHLSSVTKSGWFYLLNIVLLLLYFILFYFILNSYYYYFLILLGFAFFFLNEFIYLFIYFWLCWIFVSVRGLSPVWRAGATLHRGAQASHCRGLSCCGAQAPDAQAQ